MKGTKAVLLEKNVISHFDDDDAADNDDDKRRRRRGARRAIFFSKFSSGRRGRFGQKIVEIGVILAIFGPFKVGRTR